MPKYWGKQFFTHRRFLEVGEKQKTEKRKRLNDGNNNGQAMHGARKHAWRTQAARAKNSSDAYLTANKGEEAQRTDEKMIPLSICLSGNLFIHD